ncbi:MAG: sugar ABC transporter permease [Firmicutes bacterium]|nr:sugar ABC transporter permease [Bacillota bacterium]
MDDSVQRKGARRGVAGRFVARRSPGGLHRRRIRLAYLLILPSALVIALVLLYPLLFEFYLSTTNMSMQRIFNYQFVGIRNFATILADPQFYEVFFRTIIWTVVNVFFHVAIGLWLAILLHRKLPGRAIFRVLLLLPWAVPEYISALTWKGLFNFRYGAVNLFLGQVDNLLNSAYGLIGLARGWHLGPISWLSDPTWAFAAVMIANIWMGFPFMMAISLGGLQSIPHELYEAADIDGASGWRKFRNVTLPLLKPVLIPSVVLGTIWTFNKLNVIYLITLGGPGDKTHILVTTVYRAAFDYYRYGYAAAFSVVMFFILLLFTVNFVKHLRGTEAVY